MSRDHKRLQVFQLADDLVMDVYRSTTRFPPEERYGLQAQLRRASVSVPCNIVEGAARESDADYGRFLRIACGSASEARYLVSIANRLGYLPKTEGVTLETRFGHLVRGLEVLCQRVAGSHKRG
jgi:four helix bundle protein